VSSSIVYLILIQTYAGAFISIGLTDPAMHEANSGGPRVVFKIVKSSRGSQWPCGYLAIDDLDSCLISKADARARTLHIGLMGILIRTTEIKCVASDRLPRPNYYKNAFAAEAPRSGPDLLGRLPLAGFG